MEIEVTREMNSQYSRSVLISSERGHASGSNQKMDATQIHVANEVEVRRE